MDTTGHQEWYDKRGDPVPADRVVIRSLKWEGTEPRHPVLRNFGWEYDQFHDILHGPGEFDILHGPGEFDIHHHHGPNDYDFFVCSEQHDEHDEPRVIIHNKYLRAIGIEYGPAVHDHGNPAPDPD